MAVSNKVFLEAVADSFRMPSSNTLYVWRILQENGFVTPATRGRSGSTPSFRDAAMVTTAAVAYRSTTDLADAMQAYSKMKAHHTARAMTKLINGVGGKPDVIEDFDAVWHLEGFEQPQMKALPKHHNFIAAFAALLNACATNDSHPVTIDPTVTISATYCVADISLRLTDFIPGQSPTFSYWEEAGYEFAKRTRPAEEAPGIEFSATISARTIREFATLLKS